MKLAPQGGLLRTLWLSFCIAAFTTGLALLLGYVLAWRSWRSEDAAWAARGLSMERFGAEHPVTHNSPAALRLDELTRFIGIEAVPGTQVPSRRPVDMTQEPVLRAVRAYMTQIESVRADGVAPETPATVHAYLLENLGTLDAIEAHLIDGGPLVFEEDIAKSAAAPIPAFLGARNLHNVLLARATEALARGEWNRASRSLEACWRHSQALQKRADLISQLIVVAVSGTRNAVLRLWPQPTAEWIDRLKADDLRPHMLASYQNEIYSWRAFSRQHKGVRDLSELDGGTPRYGTAFNHIFRFLSVPYVRLSFAGASEAMRESTDGLLKRDPCAFDPEQSNDIMRTRFPRWNIIGPSVASGLFGTWASVRNVMLDDEMTTAVMEAHRQWPVTPHSARRSQLCSGFSWVYESSNDERLTIRLEPTKMPAAKPLPWTYVLIPPSVGAR